MQKNPTIQLLLVLILAFLIHYFLELVLSPKPIQTRLVRGQARVTLIPTKRPRVSSTPTPILTPTTTPNPKPPPIKTTTPTPIKSGPTPSSLSAYDIQVILMKAFASRNYDKLYPIMAKNVDVAIYATECCGSESREEALNFIKDYVNRRPNAWYYLRSNPVIAKIAEKKDFASSIIFLHEDNSLLVFNLNSVPEIVVITKYSSYRLITD